MNTATIEIKFGKIGVIVGYENDPSPAVLGDSLIAQIKKLLKGQTNKVIISMFKKLKIVDDTTMPLKQDFERFEQKYSKNQSWYDLTKSTQGDLNAILESGHIYQTEKNEEYHYTIDWNRGAFSLDIRSGGPISNCQTGTKTTSGSRNRFTAWYHFEFLKPGHFKKWGKANPTSDTDVDAVFYNAILHKFRRTSQVQKKSRAMIGRQTRTVTRFRKN